MHLQITHTIAGFLVAVPVVLCRLHTQWLRLLLNTLGSLSVEETAQSVLSVPIFDSLMQTHYAQDFQPAQYVTITRVLTVITVMPPIDNREY